MWIGSSPDHRRRRRHPPAPVLLSHPHDGQAPRCVPNHVGDRGVPEEILDEARVGPLVGKLIACSVPQHMRMDV